MTPSECIKQMDAIKRTLGEEAYAVLEHQLGEAGLNIECMVENLAAAKYVTMPASHAAAILLRQLRHQFPHHPMSGWSLLEQLKAVYAIIACDAPVSFYGASISFASDLEAEQVVKNFNDYPYQDIGSS